MSSEEERESLRLSAAKYARTLQDFANRCANELEMDKTISAHELEIEEMLHRASVLRGYLIELKRARVNARS